MLRINAPRLNRKIRRSFLSFAQPTLLLFLVFILSSCNKDQQDLPAIQQSVGRDVRLNDVIFLDNQRGFTCGGVKNEVGYIYKTIDGGNTWTEIILEHDFGMHCLFFLNDTTAWLGGDYLHFYKTTDAGLTWEFQWLSDQVPENEEDRPVIRGIQFLDSENGYFVGGEYYNSGVVYHTTDGGQNWTWNFYENDLRDLHVLDCEQAMFCGHGLALESSNCDNQQTDLGLYNKFYVAVHQFDEENIVLAGNEGGIYRSSDGGESWNEIVNPNSLLGRRAYINSMNFDGHIGFATGNDGLLLYSHDSGMSWEEYSLEGSPILLAVHSIGNKAWCSSIDGKIYTIEL